MILVSNVVETYMEVLESFNLADHIYETHVEMYLTSEGISPETIIQESNRLIDIITNNPDYDGDKVKDLKRLLRADFKEKVLRKYFPNP